MLTTRRRHDHELQFRLTDGVALRTTPVFEAYWSFALERQEILYRRLAGVKPPWTDDPILQRYRFTNPYRASDKVSQFLIRDVLYRGDPSPDEVFFRTILFKMFNRIGTWTSLERRLGTLSWAKFDFDEYNNALNIASAEGETLYSAAYIMPNPPFGARRKHANHLLLLTQMMHAGTPQRVATAKSLQEVFELLRSFPSIGDFLAFQYAIDLNYSELLRFSEMDFVVAGPGARSGIRKAFLETGGLSDEELIRQVTFAAPREFAKRGFSFRTLWGRPLQLIDCQNLFCEIDKYSRLAFPEFVGSGRTRIKRTFAPAADTLILPWYPPKWQLQPSESTGARAAALNVGPFRHTEIASVRT